jgi:uncharacterized membrane protein YtjA (UPF0391 family)
MLLSALVFFLIALASALLGFGSSGIAAAALIQFIFYGAVALLVVSLMAHLMRRV